MPKVVPEYKEEARSKILEAANKVFAEKGYHQATMEDVAKHLGVSKGALYLYYASKEELFEAMCRTAPQAFKGILVSSFGTVDASPVDSASRFFDKMLQQYGSNPGLSFEILSEASHDPALRKILSKNQEDYTSITASFLEKGLELGFVRKDIDLKALSRGLVALWNGIETLLVSGVPVSEARHAWQETLKAIFQPWHQRLPSSQTSKPVKTWERGKS